MGGMGVDVCELAWYISSNMLSGDGSGNDDDDGGGGWCGGKCLRFEGL